MTGETPAKSIASSAMPNAANNDPISCSTHLSKDVHLHLRRMQLTGRAWDVCTYAHDLTFGNAGWHRKQGKSELSCTFDLASWAEALGINRSNLQRILARLVKHKIITFIPYANLPGRATITWNINFQEWVAGYDSHRTSEQARNLGLHSQKKPSELNLLASENVPSELSTPVLNETIRTKHASLERTIRTKGARSDIASSVAALTPNKSTEEEYTEEETYMVADATQAKLFHFGDTPAKLPIVTFKQEASKRGGSKKKQTKIEQLLSRRPELHPLHEMALSLFGKPMGLPALNWADYIEELGDRPVTAEQLEAASVWYKREHPTWHHSLKAVTSHYHEFEQAIQKGAGRGISEQNNRNNPGESGKSYSRFILPKGRPANA